MVSLKIDGQAVSVPEKTTILDAAESIGIEIPHLCYLKEINDIGACRLCCVQVEGEDRLVPACHSVVEEGMVIHTNNARVRAARLTNLKLILSQHDCRCALCVRNGTCRLQKIAGDMGLTEDELPQELPSGKLLQWNRTFPLIRDNTKCIKCMRCIQICDKVQSLHIWDMSATGSRTQVNVSGNRQIEDADCSLCGQCITHCPVGALRERDDTRSVFQALEDPDIVTVAQIAPAVRTSWGESFGLTAKEAGVNCLAGVLKEMGFDYVFDTSFAADLTVMEESSELLERLKEGGRDKLPMFTSCCPAWVRFLKGQYPQLAGQLSTAKSPQQMFGAVIKTCFAKERGIEPEKIRLVSIMPCLAKKAECALPTMRNQEGTADVDFSLTTRELVRMIRACHIPVKQVKETAFDRLFGSYTGAGVIFGMSGGVMDAALRTAYYLATGNRPEEDAFRNIREADGIQRPWREAEFQIGDRTLRIAVVSGLGNARRLCEELLRGTVSYDFAEVMACPGGCAGGGGQPLHCDDRERAAGRGQILDRIDSSMQMRCSHENPDIIRLYEESLDHPLSEKAEALLHTDHSAWKMPGEKPLLQTGNR